MTVIRPMFPPRQTDTASIVDDHLVPLKFMAEFAASLVCDDMDANGAQEGYFHIRRDEGEDCKSNGTKGACSKSKPAMD
jgi:hypothetical protein